MSNLFTHAIKIERELDAVSDKVNHSRCLQKQATLCRAFGLQPHEVEGHTLGQLDWMLRVRQYEREKTEEYLHQQGATK